MNCEYLLLLKFSWILLYYDPSQSEILDILVDPLYEKSFFPTSSHRNSTQILKLFSEFLKLFHLTRKKC